jgi:hypothetical protein
MVFTHWVLKLCLGNLNATSQQSAEGRIFTIEPLSLACETHHPRLMEIALEGFHFMIGITIIC